MIVHGITLRASICPHCGGRLYPAKSLPAHLERHNILLAKAVGNGEGWNNGRTPHTRKGNFKGRPRKRDSEKVKIVAIPRQGGEGHICER